MKKLRGLFDKWRRGAKVRRERSTGYHLSWAGIVATLLVGAAGLAPVTDEGAVVLSVVGVACLVAWVVLSGWRLRSPIRRLPRGKQLTRAEEEDQASTRKVKSALVELFHARARPAVEQLRQIVSSFVEELEGRPEPFALCGLLTKVYVVSESTKSEQELRRVLEGPLWDAQEPKYDKVRRFSSEREVEKQSAWDVGWAFYGYYCDYRMLLSWTWRLARVLGIALDQDDRFIEWRRLDAELTLRLRDVLAFPEMASHREGFEKFITAWVEAVRRT